MTIDEAIDHCENVARRKLENSNNQECIQCGEEHLQLAMWLRELKEYEEREKQRVEAKEKGENTSVHVDVSE